MGFGGRRKRYKNITKSNEGWRNDPLQGGCDEYDDNLPQTMPKKIFVNYLSLKGRLEEGRWVWIALEVVRGRLSRC